MVGHQLYGSTSKASPRLSARQRDRRTLFELEPLFLDQSVTFTATVAAVAQPQGHNRNGHLPGWDDHLGTGP